jgi:hypothetical protein
MVPDRTTGVGQVAQFAVSGGARDEGGIALTDLQV